MQAIDILTKVKLILEKYALCDSCLGRLFALLGRGFTNSERGKSLKTAVIMDLHSKLREGDSRILDKLKIILENCGLIAAKTYEDIYGSKLPEKKCYICGSMLENFKRNIAKRIVEILDREYHVKTYLLAASVDANTRSKEEELKKEFSLAYSESLASELKREISKIIQSISNYTPSFDNPDVVILIKYPEGNVIVNPMPLLLRAKYRKLARNISQSRWILWDGTSKYPYSVEDALTPLTEICRAERAILHAAGREDVDVRMLGQGRPAVIEIKKPKSRLVDLTTLEETLNKHSTRLVEFKITGYAKRSDVRLLKEEARTHIKVYRALVLTDCDLTLDDLRNLEDAMRNRVIRQRTPRRVRHRRPDVVRTRRVYEVKTKLISSKLFEALIKCEGGLYVKELVSGDNGDTKPSFSEILGCSAICLELDVLAVKPLITS